MTDAVGVPLAATITAANTADVTEALRVVTSVPPMAGKPGQPKSRPGELIVGKAYDSKDLRSILEWLGLRPDIPSRGDDSRGLRALRWPVERTIAWLHQFRRLAVR